MGQRDKGENWKNVNYKSIGSGIGVIIWIWRKKKCVKHRLLQLLMRLFFLSKNEKGAFFEIIFLSSENC